MASVFYHVHCSDGIKISEHTSQLLAYMVTILKASQEYQFTGWITYDVVYQQQAASTGHKRHSEEDTLLETVCFITAGKQSLKCEVCLSKAIRYWTVQLEDKRNSVWPNG